MDYLEFNQFVPDINQASLDSVILSLVRHLNIQLNGPGFFQMVSGYGGGK